jgi:hypothetical protein
MYNMGLVYFDQATKHCLLALNMQPSAILFVVALSCARDQM